MDEKVYIISREDETVGLFSNVLVFLGHIRYAIEKGYIPVIDLQSRRNILLTEEEVGSVNGWEYYFEQPSGMGLSDLGFNRQVLSSLENTSFSYLRTYNLHYHPRQIRYWHDLYRKYIRLNRQTLEHIDSEYHSLISEKDRVLGVLLRGTDYTQRKPYGHPIQPDKDMAISKCIEIMNEKKCNKLFLATEDPYYFEAFSGVFKSRLITTNDNILYANTGDRLLSDVHIGLHREKYLRALDYLTKIVILSRCTCFAAGQTSGSIGAMILSGGFEYSYLWDLGRYGLEDSRYHYSLKFFVRKKVVSLLKMLSRSSEN